MTNLFKYKVVRENGHKFTKIFTINEIENGYAQTWLKNNMVCDTDELERLPYVTDDKNGDKVFAGDRVKMLKERGFLKGEICEVGWSEHWNGYWLTADKGNTNHWMGNWVELIKDKDNG